MYICFQKFVLKNCEWALYLAVEAVHFFGELFHSVFTILATFFMLLLTFGGMFSSFPNILQIKMHWSFLVIWKLFHQKSSQKYRKRGFQQVKLGNFHEIFQYVWETWKTYFFPDITRCAAILYLPFLLRETPDKFLKGQNTINQELWWLELTSLGMTC